MPFTTISTKACVAEFSAQTLNNRAAMCIEVGRYEEAYVDLSNAMGILNVLGTRREYSRCACNQCTLQSCLDHSIERPAKEAPGEGHFLHRQPIFINEESMGHCMGKTMQVIIWMNLALTYHLTALEREMKLRTAYFRKAFEMYQSVMGEITSADQNPEILRLVMAIANNLGEIHRTVGNQDKWGKCMEHLLSTIMLYVYCYQRKVNDSSAASSSSSSSSSALDEGTGHGRLFNGLMNNLSSSSVLQSKAARAA